MYWKVEGGGTYVCEYNILDFMEVIFPFSEMEQIDRISMFEFRKIIETQTAALAAMRQVPLWLMKCVK